MEVIGNRHNHNQRTHIPRPSTSTMRIYNFDKKYRVSVRFHDRPLLGHRVCLINFVCVFVVMRALVITITARAHVTCALSHHIKAMMQ